ncbi:hypothetical protein MRX96_049470 [Rhipicephalus microplus]
MNYLSGARDPTGGTCEAIWKREADHHCDCVFAQPWLLRGYGDDDGSIPPLVRLLWRPAGPEPSGQSGPPAPRQTASSSYPTSVLTAATLIALLLLLVARTTWMRRAVPAVSASVPPPPRCAFVFVPPCAVL